MKNTDPDQCTGCWHAFIFYFNREDPRIIVPKRFRSLGWTINFARPMAIPTLLIIIAVLLAPFKILATYGIDSKTAYYTTVAIELVTLILFCNWMSNLSRLEKKQK